MNETLSSENNLDKSPLIIEAIGKDRYEKFVNFVSTCYAEKESTPEALQKIEGALAQLELMKQKRAYDYGMGLLKQFSANSKSPDVPVARRQAMLQKNIYRKAGETVQLGSENEDFKSGVEVIKEICDGKEVKTLIIQTMQEMMKKSESTNN